MKYAYSVELQLSFETVNSFHRSTCDELFSFFSVAVARWLKIGRQKLLQQWRGNSAAAATRVMSKCSGKTVKLVLLTRRAIFLLGQVANLRLCFLFCGKRTGVLFCFVFTPSEKTVPEHCSSTAQESVELQSPIQISTYSFGAYTRINF